MAGASATARLSSVSPSRCDARGRAACASRCSPMPARTPSPVGQSERRARRDRPHGRLGRLCRAGRRRLRPQAPPAASAAPRRAEPRPSGELQPVDLAAGDPPRRLARAPAGLPRRVRLPPQPPPRADGGLPDAARPRRLLRAHHLSPDHQPSPRACRGADRIVMSRAIPSASLPAQSGLTHDTRGQGRGCRAAGPSVFEEPGADATCGFAGSRTSRRGRTGRSHSPGRGPSGHCHGAAASPCAACPSSRGRCDGRTRWAAR